MERPQCEMVFSLDFPYSNLPVYLMCHHLPAFIADTQCLSTFQQGIFESGKGGILICTVSRETFIRWLLKTEMFIMCTLVAGIHLK